MGDMSLNPVQVLSYGAQEEKSETARLVRRGWGECEGEGGVGGTAGSSSNVCC